MIGSREQTYFHLKTIRDSLEAFLADFASEENESLQGRERVRLEIIHNLLNRTIQELREKKEETK